MIHKSNIECQHRWPLVITNRGLRTWFCTLYDKSVNDEICNTCSAKEGKCLHPPLMGIEFPTRTDEEIAAVYKVCKGCPLLHPTHQICKKMPAEMHPVDIIAQHPSNHCPENLW